MSRAGRRQSTLARALTYVVLAALMISTVPYRHVGSLIARFPIASTVTAVLLVLAAAVYWQYELVFAVFFWGYALSGPLLAVGEKIKALREAHSG